MRIDRRAVVVEGQLALGRARVQAARGGVVGLDILTLPALAARVAGGFVSPAPRTTLYSELQRHLRSKQWPSLQPSLDLPGMPRAALETLDRMWRNDFHPDRAGVQSQRLCDLADLERLVTKGIGQSFATPRRLRDLALQNVETVSKLFPALELRGLVDVDPLWRSLISAIADCIPVVWSEAPAGVERHWFKGEMQARVVGRANKTSAEVCADPRSEVIEGLRWARALLARGIPAADIAIAATTTRLWDAHMMVLAGEADLPIYMAGGVPALATPPGSAAAALAHLLRDGPTKSNVLRLLQSPNFIDFQHADALWRTLAGRRMVQSAEQWQHVITQARHAGVIDDSAEAEIASLVSLVSLGGGAASQAGERLLKGAALELWQEALSAAPPSGIAYALGDLRLAGEREAANSVSWSSAAQLAAAPRPYVRLLGLTSVHWPRRSAPDPLLPDHVLDRRLWSPVDVSDRDRLNFSLIEASATEELALSRPMRGDQGTILSKSPLWPVDGEVVLSRVRTPAHAFGESDRLLANPKEAAALPHIRATHVAWTNWRSPMLTAHDGQLRANDPVIETMLTRTSSPTSLQRMLADPLGYLLQDILHFNPVHLDRDQLRLDPSDFGTIVHNLIGGTIARIGKDQRFATASTAEVDSALEIATEAVFAEWPLDHAVPPFLLWRRTMADAKSLARRALTSESPLPSGASSYSEVVFGIDDAAGGPLTRAQLPATVNGTVLRYRGRIDRLDVTSDGAAVVTDYKTGALPAKAMRVVFAGGRELQRVLYSMALRTALEGCRRVEARLHYLAGDGLVLELNDDEVISAGRQLEGYLADVVRILRSGRIPTRTRSEDFDESLRLLFPADREAYLGRKRASFDAAGQGLRSLWRSQ